MDLDPGGPKTRGSGSGTLSNRVADPDRNPEGQK
jgi:hypothetical protein